MYSIELVDKIFFTLYFIKVVDQQSNFNFLCEKQRATRKECHRGIFNQGKNSINYLTIHIVNNKSQLVISLQQTVSVNVLMMPLNTCGLEMAQLKTI